MLKNKHGIRKFQKYIVGGGLAAGIDLIFLFIFTDFFGIYYIISSILSFLISFFFGFFFQKYITFSDHSKNHLHQGMKFMFFQLVGLGLNIGLLWIFVTQLGFYYLYVAFVNKGIIFLRNFFMNYYFNFQHQGKNSPL